MYPLPGRIDYRVETGFVNLAPATLREKGLHARPARDLTHPLNRGLRRAVISAINREFGVRSAARSSGTRPHARVAAAPGLNLPLAVHRSRKDMNLKSEHH